MPLPSRRALWLAALGFLPAVLPTFGWTWAWLVWIVWLTALGILIGADALFAPGGRNMQFSCEAPQTVFIGEPASAEVQVGFGADRPIALAAVVDLSDEFAPAFQFVGVCPPQGGSFTVPLAARRRGLGRIESLWFQVRGPMGLVVKRMRIKLGREIAVVPNVMPARRAALQCVLDRQYLAGLKIERYRGDGSEFDSLREYIPGDGVRDIHWRSSGRHRKLVSRQFRAERNHQMVVALDAGRLMSEPIGGVPKLDRAVEAALLLGFVGLKSGDRVGLYSFADRVGSYLTPQAGVGHFRALQYASAALAYGEAETNFTLGFAALQQRLTRRSLVVVLTDFVDSITAELMLDNVVRLAQKHMVVLVTLRDGGLELLRRAEPNSVVELNRAVAAAAHRRERELVLKRLRNLGLQTIDAEPQHVGPELVNRYLEVKRKERV